MDARGSWLEELQALDVAVYRAVASTPTPRLDGVLRPLTSAADHSKLWFATAAIVALTGGRRGRAAAADGVAAIGLASATVNLAFKRLYPRRRPDRAGTGAFEARWVTMPTSTSFPSGHSASAFAFAGAVTRTAPVLGVPLYLAATGVAYTRVHAGVHYPGDVIAGALIGFGCGQLGRRLLRTALSRTAGTLEGSQR